MIGLIDIFRSGAFRDHDSPLALAMGKDITSEPVVVDTSRARRTCWSPAPPVPASQSAVNAMILSTLPRHADHVRLIMIDPKMLELSIYEALYPHLLAPVVHRHEARPTRSTGAWPRMEEPYRLMSGLRVRNLAGFTTRRSARARAAGKPLYKPVTRSGAAPEPLDTCR